MPSPTSATTADGSLQTLLLDMGLSQLRALPGLLETEHRQIDASLAQLASEQHGAFLKANECARDIATATETIGSSAQTIDKLASDLETQLAAIKPLDADDRAMDALLRDNYDELLDLLAIPGLLDAFVRTGAYEDALDLVGFVARLVLRHPNVQVVQNINAQVSASTSVMLSQLVSTLRSNAKLPQCIRVIGYLRRMEVYPETELRLAFLQQKDAYFRSLLSEIRETDPAEYLKKYIEVSRENFFDIITQYKAIFADGSSTATPSSIHHINSSSFTASSSFGNNSTPTIFHQSTTTIATASIISSYVTQTVSLFLTQLSNKLTLISDTQSLNSLLTQTMYYGMSLGRVGVDFRILVTDLFLAATERIFASILTEGIQGFYNWVQTTSPTLQGLYIKQIAAKAGSDSQQLNFSPPRQSSFSSSVNGGSSSSSSSSSTGVVNPPSQLLPYPPLAHLLNVFFTSFNALRVLAPVASKLRLRAVIDAHLVQIAAVFKDAVNMLESEVRESLGADGSEGKTLEENTRYLNACGAAKMIVEVLGPAVLEGFEVKLFGGSGAGGAGGSNVGEGGEGTHGRDAAVNVDVPKEVVDLLGGFVAVLRRNASVAAVEDRKKAAVAGGFGLGYSGAVKPTASSAVADDGAAVVTSKPIVSETGDVSKEEKTSQLEPAQENGSKHESTELVAAEIAETNGLAPAVISTEKTTTKVSSEPSAEIPIRKSLDKKLD
ncbi:Dor1-like family-domain-containing protein [Obelidium mucronatum]|nr:Dor1-like family-domain-containing protein [Obelidium mucronatum]